MPECRATPNSDSLPSSPVGLTANGTTDGVIISWEANAVSEGVTSYKVYRADGRGGPFSLLDTVSETNYEDETATTDVLYWYRVTAVNPSGEGPYSDVSGSFTADVTAPADPVIATTEVVGATSVRLTWSEVTDSDLAGYNVYGRISPAAYAKLNSTLLAVRTYDHTSATAGNTWDYKVTAVDQTGNESTGDTVSIAVPAGDTTAPAVPATPVAINESTGIRITWTPNTDPDLVDYQVYRSTDSYASAIATVLKATGGTYLDTSVSVGQTYSYKVSARDAVPNESAKSAASNAVLRSSSSVGDLSEFIKAGTMVPCVCHARAVSRYTYVNSLGSGGTITTSTAEDFPALVAGNVLTAKYDWNFASGSNQPQGRYTQLRGWNAAHAYDAAGSYTIQLTRTDEAGNVETYQAVVALAADTRRVVYVSADSTDGSGAGASASSPVTLARAQALLNTTANLKIVLRCGDEFWFSTGGLRLKQANQMITSVQSWGKNGSQVKPNIGYNAPGALKPGSNTEIQGRNLIVCETGATNFVIENIGLKVSYSGGDKNKDYGIQPNGSTNGLVRNVDIIAFGSFVECPAGDGNDLRWLLVQDCRVTNNKGIKNSLIHFRGEDFVLLGCSMPNSRDEHCVRCGPSCRTLVSYCDLQNMQYNAAVSPWKDLDSSDISKQTLNIQQGFHHYACFNRLAISLYAPTQSDSLQIGPLNESTGHDGEFVKWVVIERNKIEAKLDIQRGSSYVMIRNNVISKDGDQGWMIDKHTDALFPNRTINYLYILNNTVINNTTGQGYRWPARADYVFIKGNLFVAPNFVAGGSGSTQTACVYLGYTSSANSICDRNCFAEFNKFLIGGSLSFESISAWNNRTGNSNNISLAVVLNSLYKVPTASAAKTLARPVVGVFEDYYGTARNQTAPSWVAGAVEGSY